MFSQLNTHKTVNVNSQNHQFHMKKLLSCIIFTSFLVAMLCLSCKKNSPVGDEEIKNTLQSTKKSENEFITYLKTLPKNEAIDTINKFMAKYSNNNSSKRTNTLNGQYKIMSDPTLTIVTVNYLQTNSVSPDVPWGGPIAGATYEKAITQTLAYGTTNTNAFNCQLSSNDKVSITFPVLMGITPTPTITGFEHINTELIYNPWPSLGSYDYATSSYFYTDQSVFMSMNGQLNLPGYSQFIENYCLIQLLY